MNWEYGYFAQRRRLLQRERPTSRSDLKALRAAAAETEALQDRVAVLEAAVRDHRLAVGEGYHNGSVRAQHAANVALWALVADEPAMFTGEWELPESGLDEAGLARPAHLEDEE